jgi:hypothetical protein
MVCVTTSEYAVALDKYLEWKRDNGFEVSLDTTAAAKGAQAVKSLLQNIYDRQGLSYVLLVGDYQDVPSPLIYAKASDPSYGLLAGDDVFGDVQVSRISCNTVEELKHQLNKILIHERGLFASRGWISRAVVACMTHFNGIDHARILVETMKSHPEYFQQVIQIMEEDADKTAAIKQAIEETGVNIIAHHGHGSPTGFESLSFSLSDIRGLEDSEGRFPMIHGAACSLGTFTRRDGDCFAEAMMKAGTTDKPTGAVAVLGGSSSMSPYACCVAQIEAFTKFYYLDCIETFGHLCFFSTLSAMLKMDDMEAERLYRRWHLFGDSTTPIRKKPDSGR